MAFTFCARIHKKKKSQTEIVFIIVVLPGDKDDQCSVWISV